MSIGLLLITHHQIGQEMLEMAADTICTIALRHQNISVTTEDNFDTLLSNVEISIDELEQGDGVLILTDLYGATPGNLACRLLHTKNIRVVSGLNLPMLLKVFSQLDATLEEAAQMAVEGGKRGVLLCNDDICQITLSNARN
jgi:PTS system mannose-specific IIA component